MFGFALWSPLLKKLKRQQRCNDSNNQGFFSSARPNKWLHSRRPSAPAEVGPSTRRGEPSHLLPDPTQRPSLAASLSCPFGHPAHGHMVTSNVVHLPPDSASRHPPPPYVSRASVMSDYIVVLPRRSLLDSNVLENHISPLLMVGHEDKKMGGSRNWTSEAAAMFLRGCASLGTVGS